MPDIDWEFKVKNPETATPNQRHDDMATQTSEQPSVRPYLVVWNKDGRHTSKLRYTKEQIDDIDEIVDAVVKGVAADAGFDIRVTEEPYDGPGAK